MKGGLIGMLAAAILLTPIATAAQNYEDLSKGIYFELRGGGAYLTDSDIDASAAGFSASGEAEFDPGFAVEGAAGYEHLGGKSRSVMLGGTESLAVVCHPAWSAKRTAWALVLTWDEISSRCHCMAWVLQRGRTRAAPTPRAGQMAPKI